MGNSAAIVLDPAASSHPRSPSDPGRAALEFYSTELAPMLEAEHSGQYVAIHPDTRSYAVERRPGKAFRALRDKQPIGSIIVHNIGPANFGLKARMQGEQPR